LLTGTLSSNTILDIVISSATVISDATAVAAYLYWDADTLALARSTGLSARFTSDPAFPLIKAAQQKPVLIENADTDPRVSYYPPLLMQQEKAAWAELPLAVGETGVGVIVFYYDEPQTFTEDRVEILRAFAGQAAQAIKNARQYSTTDEALENQVKQMYTLANLGRQLTATMNMTAIGDLVLARALEMCHATAGLIIIRHEADWIILAQSGDLPTPLLPLTVQQTITGQVLQTGQPIRYHDIRQETAYPALNRSTRSQLTVPVLRNSATLGAITLESDRIGEFSEEDSYFVTQLANQMVIAIDNTRLFEDIAEARDQLAVIVNAVTDGMILIDKTGNIALANPRVDLIGLKSELLLNQNIEGLLEKPELDLAERLGFQSDQKLRKLLKELRAADSWVGVEPHSYTVESDNKTRYIQREVIPIPGADGEPEGMLLVIYDETEQKELAQMRQDLSDMLVHDLRSPLSAVTTGLKLLREVVPPDNDLRPVVESTTETSQRAIRKLMSRVNSLLDISKMQNGQVSLETEPTELTTLADNVCLELNPLAQELSVLLKSQVDDHLPPLAVDADKVERVLQNLVDNALKFAPAETTVTIRSYPPGTDGAAPQYVRIDVMDQGPGVPDEYKERLFERFVQIKGRRGTRRGSGLGLTFCRLVVEAHGGRIWVADNPTGGSIFALTLPLTNLTRFDETGEHPALNNLPHS
jgi:PAS domain S-box-containing protein